jgi:hypothetical protein
MLGIISAALKANNVRHYRTKGQRKEFSAAVEAFRADEENCALLLPVGYRPTACLIF